MNKHEVFSRLVGRVLGALDLAHVDENLKKTVKAYIWQAKRDLCVNGEENEQEGGRFNNDGREQRN